MADEYQLRRDLDRFNFFLNQLEADFEEYFNTSEISFDEIFKIISSINDHDHDDLYYTKAEIDNMISQLNGGSNDE